MENNTHQAEIEMYMILSFISFHLVLDRINPFRYTGTRRYERVFHGSFLSGYGVYAHHAIH